MLTLGLELISDVTVALAELVKNAYDADATCVLIKIVPPDGGDPGRVDVLDDGSGMTAETVASVWLEPATPSRRRRKKSATGRRSLGEKGLGRFATAKIAYDTELVTRSVDTDEVRLRVDWRDFDDDDRYLDEVPVNWSQGPVEEFTPGGAIATMWEEVRARYLTHEDDPAPSATSGTFLRLRGVRAALGERELVAIRQSLSRLVTPVLGTQVPDFTVVLEVVGEEERLSGVIGPPEEILRPHYRLDGVVDAAGRATVTMSLRGKTEPVEAVVFLPGREGRSQAAGAFSATILAWDRNNSSLEEVAGAGRDAASVRRTLDSLAGVSVYRDGFRVLPYGEYGDDWLGLDRRRINDPSRRLSNNQVVGSVSITADDNPGLVDQTNREGLVSGPPFDDLRVLVLEMLSLLEVRRQALRAQPPKRPPVNIIEPPKLDDLRRAANEREDDELLDLVTDAEAELATRTEQTREVLARYQRLATLGQLVDTMLHEVGQPAAAIRSSSTAALGAIGKAERGGLVDTCAEVLGVVRDDLETVRQQATATMEILNRLAPFGGRKRGRPRTITVERAVRDAVGLMEHDLRDIELMLPDGDTAVTVDGTELQEVLLNLIRNSSYWVTRSPRDITRRIMVEVERNDDGSVSMTISDSGPGVSEEDHDHVFDPYFSTRDGGSGLGLSIAGEIVEEYYGGELELMSPGPLGGASFRATMRHRV